MAKSKRLLSLLMALAMVISLLPNMVWASDDVTENTPTTNTPAGCICGSNNGKHREGCDGTRQNWEDWTSEVQFSLIPLQQKIILNLKRAMSLPEATSLR